MKQVITGAIAAFYFFTMNTVHADPILQIICEDCRGPEYSQDFGNFAFNQVFGSGAWVQSDQAGEFIIVNLQGDQVFVDLDFVLSDFTSVNLLDMFEIEFGWPTGFINIFTQTSNGVTDNYPVNLEAALLLGGLGVGAGDEPDSDSGGGNSGGSNGWGSGTGSNGGGSGGGGGLRACTSAGDGVWVCVDVNEN